MTIIHIYIYIYIYIYICIAAGVGRGASTVPEVTVLLHYQHKMEKSGFSLFCYICVVVFVVLRKWVSFRYPPPKRPKQRFSFCQDRPKIHQARPNKNTPFRLTPVLASSFPASGKVWLQDRLAGARVRARYNLPPLIRNPPNKIKTLGGNKYGYYQFRRRHYQFRRRGGFLLWGCSY